MNEPNEGPRTRTGAPLTVARAAALVGGRVVGDGSVRVAGVAPVDEAEPDELAFLALKRYTRFAADSAARAFLLDASLTEALPDGRAAVVVEDPYPALRTLLGHFYPEVGPEPGVHPTAIVGGDVRLGSDVHVGPYVVIEDGVVVGDGCTIGAHCVIGRDSRVGARALLHPQVVLYHGSVLGDDVVVHSGARIGPDGFGYTFVDGAHRKMPQVGRAVVEDDVEIGANVTIDRGSLGDTVVGRGVKIDNLVHVAHNVKLGALSLLAALSGVAGSTRLGKNVWLGGRAGVINQLEVGDDARIAVGSLVMRDVPAGETMSGMPARPHREEMRKQAQLARLYRLVERVDRLEEDVRRLEGET